MPELAVSPLFALLHLDRAHTTSLYRQLYDELRTAILTGRLHPGERLPSTRRMASELGVSRRTVLDAFLQLYAEGYIEGRIGAGTFVAHTLPDDLLQPASVVSSDASAEHGQTAPRFSERFQRQQGAMPASLAGWSPAKSNGWAFMIGVPAFDAFPAALWGRLVARLGRSIGTDLLTRDRIAGYAPLREAVAAYLGAARGVRCGADQVIIVNGSQQALSLIAHVLLDPGDAVWIEDPGYFGTQGALLGAGVNLVPVPVDGEGLDVAAGRALSPAARMAFVTPSHQMPLGVTLSLSRRRVLLDWAQTADAWVVEDDYDSEFRYASRPLAALQGLDTAGRVLYTGTFSKVLFPGLRLGYLVVPPTLVEAFTTARFFADMYSPLLEQLLVTEFIQAGHFERHIRRMRALYAERQAALVEATHRSLAGRLDVRPADSGMHLLGRLPAGTDDVAVARAAREQGVRMVTLSRLYLGAPAQSGLLLGYAAVSPDEIRAGVRCLEEALGSVEGEDKTMLQETMP